MSEVELDALAAQERIARGAGTPADHHAIAVAAYRRGDAQKALDEVERSRALGGRGGAGAYLHGLVLRELGRLEEAAEALEEAAKVAERDPLRAKALSSLGAVRCLLGDSRGALDPLARACALRPEMREARHNLGVAAVRAREWEVAAEAFLKLAQDDPGSRAQRHYLRLLVDVGRAAALDEMRAQGHKLKNLIGLLGDKARALSENVPEAETARAHELLNDLEQLYSGMRSYLDAMREEPFELDLLDLNALVGRCLFALSPSFGMLSVEKRLEAGLAEIVGDKASIEEVFTNLVRNAIEALRLVEPSEGPHIVVITRTVDRGRVAIDVSDKGPGLDPDDRERIFRLGFTTKPRGSGIGLAQVRKLVHAHGGEVEVSSDRGHGATFTIVLPTSPPPEPALPRLDVRSPLFENLGDLVFVS